MNASTQQNKTSTIAGPLMMLGAGICFSIGGLLCKVIPWNAFALNGVRNIIAAIMMGAYLKYRGHKVRVNPTILFGSASYIGVTSLFVLANKMTTAASSIVLQFTEPIFLILLMAILFHKKPAKDEIIATAIVIAGVICFFFSDLFGGTGGTIAGDLVAIAAGFCYALVFMMNTFPEGDSFSSLIIGQILCGILFSPLVVKETDFSTSVLLSVLVLGVVQIGLAYILFSEGTKRTPAITASLITVVEPILNPIWVAIFYGESMTALSIVGAFIVLTAVLVYNIRQLKATPSNRT